MPPLCRDRLEDVPLRVSAISFLNPAPLLYSFEHEPDAAAFRRRYTIHYTTPARCAGELHAGEADLGLIPIAELTPALHVVPGCTIASLRAVRSILLLVRCRPGQLQDSALRAIRSVAVDNASRSSTAYLRTILHQFYRNDPALSQQAADPFAMLEACDAALLIGDPALLAREQQDSVSKHVTQSTGDDLLWIDVAALWQQHTQLPWVAAVWAVRPTALSQPGISATQLVQDLLHSRDLGLAHTEQLVAEWVPRLALPASTIRTYLTQNIHYMLDNACLRGAATFRKLAAEAGVLAPLPAFTLLQPEKT